MATGALIGSTVLGAYSSYKGYKGQQEQARLGEKSAKQRAVYLDQRKRMAQSVAIQRTELEIAMETERLTHETDYLVGQLKKKEVKALGEATTGYAASGITVKEGSGSVEDVLGRIKSEAKSQRDIVRETATLELEQFTKSKQQSLEWFMEQSEFETAYGVETSLDAAKAFGEQADVAQLGSVLGPLSVGLSGAATYGMHQESLKIE